MFERVPDVSFIDDLRLESLMEELVKEYENEYKRITGNNEYTLPKVSPYRFILNAVCLQLFQGFMWLDNMGKMNLLKYSSGPYLDNMAVAFGIERKMGEPSKCKIRFKLSSMQTSNIPIPKNTRVTDGSIYFRTTKFAEIAAGKEYIDVDCECVEVGGKYNDIGVGRIKILVDSIPYIESVSNTNTTEYGADVEDDETLRERIFLASSTYSVAGPIGAYEYHTKAYSSLISDVRVTNPSPRVVDIRVVLKGGEKPDAEFCRGLKEYLSSDDRKPLTDVVEVNAPQDTNYNINLKYFINDSDKANVTNIQAAVTKAIEDFKRYQSERIGRDVNPSMLVSMIVTAGAKRVEIVEPAFISVDDAHIAILRSSNITYGGLESD